MSTQEDLLLELLAAGPPAPQPKSVVDQILATYGDRGRAGLEAVLGNRDWPTTAIHKVLRDAGHSLSETSLRRYRKDRYGV